MFKMWKTMVEKQIGKQVKRLRTDNGLEFCSKWSVQIKGDYETSHSSWNTSTKRGCRTDEQNHYGKGEMYTL